MIWATYTKNELYYFSEGAKAFVKKRIQPALSQHLMPKYCKRDFLAVLLCREKKKHLFKK